MNTNSRPPTAKIYQFPRKTSAGAGAPSREIKPALHQPQRAAPSFEFGGGWYHEAAIQAECARKP
ncbi:MAG: DUF2735 domain-containing protein [Roseiarcus sp.]|jgi:hypothetical protein